MREERATPLRRTCPICGGKARDLQEVRIGGHILPDMCPSCRDSMQRTDVVSWEPLTFMLWAAARARRCERARWRESQRLMNLVEDLCERPLEKP